MIAALSFCEPHFTSFTRGKPWTQTSVRQALPEGSVRHISEDTPILYLLKKLEKKLTCCLYTSRLPDK